MRKLKGQKALSFGEGNNTIESEVILAVAVEMRAEDSKVMLEEVRVKIWEEISGRGVLLVQDEGGNYNNI